MNRADDLAIRISPGGEAAIDELVRDRQSQELFLDFKRSLDDRFGPRLSDLDRANFANVERTRLMSFSDNRIASFDGASANATERVVNVVNSNTACELVAFS